jgi:hypothetical protein
MFLKFDLILKNLLNRLNLMFHSFLMFHLNLPNLKNHLNLMFH